MATKMRFVIFLFLLCWLRITHGDSLHPVRFPNEEAFFRAKTHERSMTLDEMEKKLRVVRDRRNYQPWSSKNVHVHKILSRFNSTSVTGRRRPNILFMLADDLGYGDLSVEPFTLDAEKRFPCGEGGYLSPNLEKMAQNGIVMTNFHSAAPVCSPARAAIMTGLYSWRMTAMNAFELGRDLSQRNGFLPQIPTIPELFREFGYYTAHSGKWHLGGMREELRKDRVYHDKCARPSPNQHGFEEYISELDGPESPRYTFLLQTLHTLGHHHLLKDDIPVPIIEQPNVQNILSDREAEDAVQFIRQQTKSNPDQPWFVQVWFNAPHHPWELLHDGEKIFGEVYNKSEQDYAKHVCPWDNVDYPLREQQSWKYKTMVAAMDRSIGKLLSVLEELKLAEDTLVLFTSDNGNEDGSGSGGLFKEGKRSLMEGGVRVPMIMQWKGVIPSGSYSPYFAGHTDLFPTFLEAADIPRPPHLKFDGVSLLPIVTQAPLAPKRRRDLRDRHYHVPVGSNIPGDSIIQQRLWQRYQQDEYLQYHINLTFGIPSTTYQKDPNRWSRLPPSTYSSLTEPVHIYATTPAASNGTATRQLYLVQPGKTPGTSVTLPRPDLVSPKHTHHKGGHHHKPPVSSSDTHSGVSATPPTTHAPPAPPPHTPSEIEYVASNRVFLWHKDTDPYRQRDDRMGSAGYFDHVKVIAQGRRGCIEKIFDLRHDAFEDRNLLPSPYNQHSVCKLPIYDVDGAALRHALVSNHDLPLPEHCLHKDTSKDTCREKYIAMVVFKTMVVVRKLLPFMRDGNHGHQLYMQEDAEKAVCDVPVMSRIQQMDFLRDTNCEHSKYGCTFPEY